MTRLEATVASMPALKIGTWIAYLLAARTVIPLAYVLVIMIGCLLLFIAYKTDGFLHELTLNLGSEVIGSLVLLFILDVVIRRIQNQVNADLKSGDSDE